MYAGAVNTSAYPHPISLTPGSDAGLVNTPRYNDTMSTPEYTDTVSISVYCPLVSSRSDVHTVIVSTHAYTDTVSTYGYTDIVSTPGTLTRGVHPGALTLSTLTLVHQGTDTEYTRVHPVSFHTLIVNTPEYTNTVSTPEPAVYNGIGSKPGRIEMIFAPVHIDKVNAVVYCGAGLL